MTIVVATVSSEGIVLAADSRTSQLRSGGQRRVASDTAHKVFDALGRVGIATYGLADIRGKTVRSLVEAWRATVAADADHAQLCGALGQFFSGHLPAQRGVGAGTTASVGASWPIGFLVASYDEAGHGSLSEVKVWSTHHEVSLLGGPDAGPSVFYRGQTSAIRRLCAGVDMDELKAGQVRLSEDTRQALETLQYEYVGPTTTQDAADFAQFLVEVTIQTQRFTDGTVTGHARDGRGPVPGCGGPVQALAIEPGGVTWLRRNELVPRTPLQAPTD